MSGENTGLILANFLNEDLGWIIYESSEIISEVIVSRFPDLLKRIFWKDSFRSQ